ncbi:hypothetical protein JCM6882_006897 [Rhodosporidiobolus microsporus]
MTTVAYVEPGSPTQRDDGVGAFSSRTVVFELPSSPLPRYAPAIPAYAPPLPCWPAQAPPSKSPVKSPQRRFLQLFRANSSPPMLPAPNTVVTYQRSTSTPPPAWEEPAPPPPPMRRRRSSAFLRSLTLPRSDVVSSATSVSTVPVIGGLPTPFSATSSSPQDARRTSVYSGTFDLRTALVLQEEQHALRSKKEGKEKAKRLSLHLGR